MFQFIANILFKGALSLLMIQLAVIFGGNYLGFVVYHMVLGLYFVTGGILHPDTIVIILLAFFLIILKWLTRAAQKILGF